mmetsp:Transcript_27709/g.69452  ORF Transcript_27709/g.69452 Transcript_27709/m.69452 type:complete len:335 (-) Transcript_27709:117-1121(-)
MSSAHPSLCHKRRFEISTRRTSTRSKRGSVLVTAGGVCPLAPQLVRCCRVLPSYHLTAGVAVSVFATSGALSSCFWLPACHARPRLAYNILNQMQCVPVFLHGGVSQVLDGEDEVSLKAACTIQIVLKAVHESRAAVTLGRFKVKFYRMNVVAGDTVRAVVVTVAQCVLRATNGCIRFRIAAVMMRSGEAIQRKGFAFVLRHSFTAGVARRQQVLRAGVLLRSTLPELFDGCLPALDDAIASPVGSSEMHLCLRGSSDAGASIPNRSLLCILPHSLYTLCIARRDEERLARSLPVLRALRPLPKTPPPPLRDIFRQVSTHPLMSLGEKGVALGL